MKINMDRDAKPKEIQWFTPEIFRRVDAQMADAPEDARVYLYPKEWEYALEVYGDNIPAHYAPVKLEEHN